MPERIRLNAFDMTCVAHQSFGLWRHPEDQSHRYQDLAYWTELAQLLERGDRKSTRLNSSHSGESRMPSSA